MTKKLKQVTCITVDVVNSRKHRKREELEKIITAINQKHQDSLLVPFVIRSGDELFGISKNIGNGYDVYKSLYALTKKHNTPVYIGVGVGDLFEENHTNSDLVQGDAIWHAADALKSLKEKNKLMKTIHQHTNKSFQYEFKVSKDMNINTAINYFVFFIMEKISKRTEKQHYIIDLIENNPSKKYKEFAEELNYDDKHVVSNVSKLLRRAEYDVVKEAETSFIHLLQSLTLPSESGDLDG
ncbi:hypothetical protein CR203_04455 [Salipaludibacillus neizhouensis]|uniref:SatD family (SatD) n=1 Tax=Salipaludibacillus neizhouensis TaxID=885475 RepID=A0A3A9K8G3_9BACI|nr:SatD family protein [Salipaludibacillus neizhouensis]RKL69284.1 hypothetical protein CR203_04455 [Salipaludibacillus neizhouensis]